MKVIRKAVLVFMAILLVVVETPVIAVATTTATLFAYSNSDSGAQEYAGSMLCSFARAHGYSGDFSDITLGAGISIYNPDDCAKTLFPVWKNGEIVYTLLVLDAGDYFTGSFSEAYAEQLNALQSVATQQAPVYLVAEDSLYAVIGNKWYDLNDEAGSYVVKSNKQPAFNGIVNVGTSISYVVTPQPRIPTTYYKGLTIYRTQPHGTGYCYAYSMATILTNMMANPTNLAFDSYYRNLTSYVGSPGASNTQVANFLSSYGYNYAYAEYGYLAFDNVKYALYYQNSYLYIGTGKVEFNGSFEEVFSHAVVISGYSDDGITQFYQLWDPFDPYTRTVQVVDGYYFVYPGPSTLAYVWDGGYITNIR